MWKSLPHLPACSSSPHSPLPRRPFMSGPFGEALAQAKKENKLLLLEFFSSG